MPGHGRWLDSERIAARCAEMKNRIYRRNNPIKKLRIPETKVLPKNHPIIQDLARLSYNRDQRTTDMIDHVAGKYGASCRTVFRWLKVYEDTHTLNLSTTPTSHWNSFAVIAETGVVGSGNRRVMPVAV